MAKYTERAIMQAFLTLLESKSLDRVTVTEIIEFADVNRNTFYYHYQDIYDLLEQVFIAKSREFQAGSHASNSFYEEYERAAEMLQAHRSVVEHLYESSSRDVLTRYLQSAAAHLVGVFVREKAEGSEISEEGLEYIICLYSSAVLGVTMEWIRRGMPAHREDLIRTMSDSFEACIQDLIGAYIAGHPLEK